MAMMKVGLDIGFSNATREDIIEIDDDDLDACETEGEKEELMLEVCTAWAWNYIEFNYELIKE